MWPKLSTTCLLILGICIFRILNTFLIQSFFDPDEYWQTLEPAYCEVFLKPQQQQQEEADSSYNDSSLHLDCAGYTWEWKRRRANNNTTEASWWWWLEQSLEGPIRSYLSVLPTHIFYTILKRYQWDNHFWVSQGPKILTAVTAAAPTDLAVWIMAHWLPTSPPPNLLPWFCLYCSMVSWFQGYSLVRTFSNSLETMLLTVSMTLISPELLGTAKDTTSSAKTLRYCLCFLLGGCSVAMRFSSVTAWIPMGVLLAIHHHHRRHHHQQSTTTTTPSIIMATMTFLVGVCAVFGIAGIGLACVVDRYFYGFWTIPFLGSFHFNVILGNSALYGSHPWHWYLTAGIPAITGVWLPFVVWDLKLLLLVRTNNNKSAAAADNSMQYARRNVWTIILVYTSAHSISGHKEFRFLLPILPLFCLQAGSHVRLLLLWLTQKHKDGGSATQQSTTTTSSISDMLPWLTLMALPNLIALLYLGLFHQSAPISVNHKIAALTSAATAAATAAESQQSAIATIQTYSIHYLTGACHSTPLHSYLHVDGQVPIQFDTWSLDCSPDCRSDPNVLCQSERFAKDPVGFVERAYFSASTTNNDEDHSEDGECTNEKACPAGNKSISRQPPHYLVTYSDYAMKLKSQLSALGLQEVGRFSHGINGIRIGNLLKTGDGYLGHDGMSDQELNDMYRRVALWGDFLELSIDEMVLFA